MVIGASFYKGNYMINLKVLNLKMCTATCTVTVLFTV